MIAAIAIVTGFTLTGSAPAVATGPTIELQHYNLQPEERTLLYPDTICPNAAPGEDNGFIYGTFTDSSSQVFNNLFIAYSVSNGQWNSGSFEVPADAALGSGTLETYCTHSVSGGNANLTYDSVAVTIVGQANGVTVDRTNVWHSAEFSSVTACDPNVPVSIWLHDQGNMITSNDMGTTTFALEVNDLVTANSSGAWSYSIDLVPSNGFSNPGYLYTLRATCQNYSGDFEYGSFNFRLMGDQYVALGDSYSSGVGSSSYYESSCKRSFDAYPFYLSNSALLDLDAPNHVACSGAVTHSLYSGSFGPPNWGQGQFGALSEDTEVVTLTIGGNDLGFVEAASACANYTGHVGYSCAGEDTLTDPMYERLAALNGDATGTVYAPGGSKPVHALSDVLTEIANRAPNAAIYIAGYPRLFGESTSNYDYDGDAPGAHTCTVTQGVGPVVKYAKWDADWLNSMADQLNQVIIDAVDEVQPLNVTYIEPTGFDGHALCDDYTPYVHGVIVTGLTNLEAESLHPTPGGMQYGYGESFEAAMD